MKKAIGVTLAAWCLAGFAQEPPALDETMLRSAFRDLKDPSSAQFRDIKYRADKGAWTICGEVNAKNSMGAYTGFQKFHGVASNHGGKTSYSIGPVGPIAQQFCAEDGL